MSREQGAEEVVPRGLAQLPGAEHLPMCLLLGSGALSLGLATASLLPLGYSAALLLSSAFRTQWHFPLLTAPIPPLLLALAWMAAPDLGVALSGTALIALLGAYTWAVAPKTSIDVAAGLPAVILSENGHNLGCSQALRQLLRLSAGNAKTNWYENLHPEDYAVVMTGVRRALFSDNQEPILGRLLVPEQGERWFRFLLGPQQSIQGQVCRALLLLDVDATERALRAACDQRDQLQTMLAGFEEGCLLLNADGQLLVTNAAAERLLLRRPAAGALPIWEAIEGFSGGLIERRLRQALRNGEADEFALQYGPTGRHLKFRLVTAKAGWRLYVRDCHDEHVRADHLRLLDNALHRLNDYVLITEAGRSGDRGPPIVYANTAFLSKTGFTAENLIGQSVDILFGPQTQKHEIDELIGVLRNYKPGRLEAVGYTRDQERFWVEMDWVPLLDEAGWDTHWIGVLRDITERKQLEPQRRAAQHMETVGQLTRGVAHDFNNLLTVILGNGDLLLAQLQGAPAARALTRAILEAAERGAQLMQSLLALARRQPLTPRRLLPLPFVEGLLPLLRATLREHIQLNFQPGTLCGAIFVDPAQLESALVNLALMARDSMPKGGQLCLRLRDENLDAPLSAHTETLMPGQYVLIELEDSGTGLSAAEIQALFEPFSGERQPLGQELRFARAHGFLRQSEGHIRVQSAPGKGSCTSLYLPRLRATAATAAVLRKPEPTSPQGPATILIVEDDPLLREFAAGYLQSLGHRVQAAESGEAGLALLETGASIDLLFTDILMPGGINGPELVTAARALRPTLRVLYTSGYADSSTRIGPGELLLPKPYRGETLSEAVVRALN